MHRFTADGRSAVLLDAFGLTRVTFPNKVRTVREIMASELGALDLNAAGTRVLTYRDTWCQTHLHSLSDLAPAMRSERFNHRCVGLLPDGEALVKYEREALQVVALDGTQLATLTLPWSQGLPTPIGTAARPGGAGRPCFGSGATAPARSIAMRRSTARSTSCGCRRAGR